MGRISSAERGDFGDPVACHACHKLVPDRDFVFSRPIFDVASPLWEAAVEERFKNLFEITPESELSSRERLILLAMTRKFEPFGRVAAGQAREGLRMGVARMPLFGGSLDESLPAMTQSLRKVSEPLLLIDDSAKHFLLGVKVERTTCKPGAVFLITGVRLSPEVADEEVHRNLRAQGLVIDIDGSAFRVRGEERC